MLGMRLDRKDEYNHPLGPEPNFNESVYWNGWDPDQAAGGWMRIGNRANEGYAEMSLCLHLPNGKVAFMYKRPRISNFISMRHNYYPVTCFLASSYDAS